MAPLVPAVETPSDGNDERLLIEAAQRDPLRFAPLYERHFDRVYAFIARRASDRAEAEDLTAEVFHRALENLARFEWRGVPFLAWLLQIARNSLADRSNFSSARSPAFERGWETGMTRRRERIERLDQMLDAILADRETPLPAGDQELSELLRIAQDLCELPRPEFRARLAADLLSRRTPMTTETTTPVRHTVQTLTVYLAVRPAAELVEFVKQAFGAEELVRTTGIGGGLHAEVRIGDAKVMIGGGDAWRGTPTPTALHLYVPDADAVYRRALAAGATSHRPPVDQPYGDREASVSDLAGNSWYIATHQAGGHVPPGLRSVTPYLHPRGADRLIDFLRRAFGAEEMQLERQADGTVVHAKVRVGNSVLEMGEAHAEFGPMPTMFYLYVDDVDAAYRRALSAGATSREVPALQPYGERRAAVRDPFDNEWYLAAPAR